MQKKIKNKNFILLAVIFITGCSQKSSMEEKVAAEMIDPSSVQFRNTYITKSDLELLGPAILCGELNAKNSFGGYVGFKKFYYTSGVVNIAPDPPSEPYLSAFTKIVDAATTGQYPSTLARDLYPELTKYGDYDEKKMFMEYEVFEKYVGWLKSYYSICKEDKST